MALEHDALLKILDLTLNELKQKYKLSSADIIKLTEHSVTIPLCIFTKKLSGLETIVKYLKENQDMRLKQIADLLNRDQRTIWGAYDRSKKKHKEKFSIKACKHMPASIFSNRKLSVLESITQYLKEEEKLSLSDIARLLERDPRTIWTVYSRLKKKVKKKHEK